MSTILTLKYYSAEVCDLADEVPLKFTVHATDIIDARIKVWRFFREYSHYPQLDSHGKVYISIKEC